MANYELSVTWIDGKGKKFSQSVQMVRADEAAAVTASQNFIEKQQVLTKAAPLTIELRKVIDFSGWTVRLTPDLTSDVEIQGLFTFRSGGTPSFPKDLLVPGFDEDTYCVGKNIDLADADVSAFIGVVNGQGFSTYHYEDLTVVTSGVKAFDGKAS